jgi:flagellar operon protein
MNVQRVQPSESEGRPQQRPSGAAGGGGSGVSFDQVLRAKAAHDQAVRFSSHAQQRMESGGVNLDGEAMARLQRAVDAADQKGAKDALVLMDDLALLVSISNRTVITAVDQTRRKNGVFTNIDSVVMA